MKPAKLLIFLLSFLFVISCSPIRYTTKVEPLNLEPPKEKPNVKKLSYEAVVLIDDSQILSYTQYSSDVIHTVEFPVGNILKQTLPIYFDQMFKKTKYEKKLTSLLHNNTVLIQASVNNINFQEKNNLFLSEVTVNTETKFMIYDNDLLAIALPIFGAGSGKAQKSGLVTVYKDEYRLAAYQSIFNSLKTATDKIYYVINNPKVQILEAKQLINQDPSNLLLYQIIANLSLKNNDISEALAASQMHIQLAPKNPNGYLLLYKCFLAQKKFKDAISQLEYAMSLDPKNANLLIKLYEFYIEKGKYEKALESMKRYFEQRPDDEYALFYIAKLYFSLGQYNEVIKLLDNAIKKYNFSISGIGIVIEKDENKYPMIKSVLFNSPAYKAGLREGYEIFEINGISTLPLKINEIIQFLRGEEGQEIKLSVKKPDTEEIVPFNLKRQKFYIKNYVGSFLGLIALSYLELDDKNKAKSYLDEAEKFFPADHIVKYTKARFYLKDGLYEKALAIISSMEDSEFAEVLKAIALAKLGKYEESINCYKKIVTSKNLYITEKVKTELFLSLSPYVEQLEKKAYKYEKDGHYEDALEVYAKLLEISTPEKVQWIRKRVSTIIFRNPSLIDLKDEVRRHVLQAEVLLTHNKFTEALEEYEKALKLQPFNPQIYFNMALIWEKLSDYAMAIKNMEIYLQLNPHDPKAQLIKDQMYKWRFLLENEI